MRPSVVVLGLLLAGSCVGGERATGPDMAQLALTIQPALIPSAADGSALPIHRITAVAARQPDRAVLREQSFDVSPTAASWTLELPIPVSRESIELVVHLYLLNVASDGTETVQFSGRTRSLTVSSGTRLADVDADIVRGPLSNLSVTGVTITSSPDTLYVGASSTLSATVTSAASTPVQIFWTSLDPSVLEVVDSVASGVAVGTAEVVASAGAHADTASVVVIVPAVDSVRVSPDSADVQVGQTRSYTAQLFDANGGALTGRPITWTTGNTSIAIVDGSGVVTGVAAGTTTVRATSEGMFDEAAVRVTAAPGPGGSANTWTAGSGNWSVASNWSLNRVPAAGDTVRIEQGGGYTVTLDVDATIEALVVQGVGDPTTLEVGDHQLVVNGTGPGDEVYVRTLGRVLINNGALRTVDAQNDGLLRATGALAILEFTTLDNGGSMEVATGGVLSIGNSTGSEQLQSGTIRFEGGGTLSVITNTDIRYYGGSIEGIGNLIFAPDASLILTTDLTLDGPAVLLNGASVLVSDGETLIIGTGGTLYLQSDAAPVVVQADIQLFGTLIATGSDNRTGVLQVGPAANVYMGSSDGRVTLVTGDVLNEGTIVTAGVGSTFGPGAGGQIINEPSGLITVSGGGGSFELNGELENSGSIVLASPTRLENYDDQFQRVTVHHVNTSTGAIEIFAGGELDVRLGGSSPSFTNDGHIDLLGTTSTFQVLDSASPTGSVTNTATGTLSGQGSVVLSAGLDLTNRGTLSPGSSPGRLTWTGDIAMWPTGRLDIELEGTVPRTGHDQILSTGDLVLDVGGVPNGTLEVTVPGPFVPSDGDRFAILTFQSRSGTFAAVNVPEIDGVTLDTLWAESEGIDTLYIVASGTGGAAPVNRWTGGTGAWSVGTNWSQGTVPDAADSVVIDVDGFYTITLDVNASVRNVMLGGSTGQQNLVAITPRTLTIGGASVVNTNGRLNLPGATINGTGSLTTIGQTTFDGNTVDLPITNPGWLQIGGTTVLNGLLTTTSTSLIRVGGIGGTPNLTVANSFTNNGSIELTSVSAANTTLTVGGTLTNLGTLSSLAGAGGSRTLTAPLDNQGTLNVAEPLTIDAADAAHTNSGTINVTAGPLTVTQTASGSFTNQAGSSISLTGGTPFGVGSFFYGFSITGGTLDMSAGQGGGGLGVTSVTNATLVFTPAANVGAAWNLSNVITGPISIGPDESFSMVGGSVSAPVTSSGSLWLSNATLNGDVTLANSAWLMGRGTSAINGSVTTGATTQLTVRGDATWGTAVLTISNGFTNNGILELPTLGSSSAQLVVTTGSLTNAAGATLISPNFGATTGTRTISAAVDNQGTVTVDLPLTLSSTLDQRASLTVAANQAVTVGGLMTLFPGSTTTANAGASVVTNGGCLNSGGVTNGWTCQ